MYLEILFQFIGGLGMFLYGMDNMSKGMQKIAGPKLKKILATLTSNSFFSILVGLIITGIVQSSSVSTVMAIGFINASLLTLKQGLGIILGANIGTTVTGWLLVLNIGKYGLPIVGISAVTLMFVKKDKNRTILMTIMGFGFIFLGLQIMSNGLAPLREMPEFVALFRKFSADSYFGVLKVSLVGALMTAIVQSSSATLGITITLASQGLIDYPTAVALVLGENVGTTITALLATIGASTNAKRAAYAHSLFNCVGVFWVTSIFPYYLILMSKISVPEKNIGVAIATAHTFFNVFNVILFIPFISLFDRFLTKYVKGSDEENGYVTHLSSLMLNIPSVIVDQTKIEILAMGIHIKEMFFKIEEILYDIQKSLSYDEEIFEVENKLDQYEKEIYDINFKILDESLNANLVQQTRLNLLICDEYETISDYLSRIAHCLYKMRENDVVLYDDQKEELIKLNSLVIDLFVDINVAYKNNNNNIFFDCVKKYNNITAICKSLKAQQFGDETLSKRLTPSYLDMLNYYKRISDHVFNIIEFYMSKDS